MKAADANPREVITSMPVDRQAGKPLEIDYFSGVLVRMGEGLEGGVSGLTSPTTNKVRTSHQSKDCEDAWPFGAAVVAGPRRRGD
jgi:hypothetical protein